MAEPETTARFSTGTIQVKDAPKFTWEYPVPNDDFWNDFRFTSGRNFLTCFSAEEIQQMDLKQYGSLGKEKKAHILIKILEDNIANTTNDKALWESDHKRWEKLCLALATIQGGLGNLSEQITIVESLLERRVDKSNLSHAHNLAGLMIDAGNYRKSEELAGSVTPWLDGKLGKDSPQSLSSRRTMIKAVWKQGRKQEAEGLISEVLGLIEESGNGQYGVYQEEERRMTLEMLEDLTKSD